jgi:hypothetical protein
VFLPVLNRLAASEEPDAFKRHYRTVAWRRDTTQRSMPRMRLAPQQRRTPVRLPRIRHCSARLKTTMTRPELASVSKLVGRLLSMSPALSQIVRVSPSIR